MNQSESLEKLQKTLQRKEREAAMAQDKGQKSVYGNLLLEIKILKEKIKKHQMGSK